MPRKNIYNLTDEKLKRTKLAREQLQLTQERAEWTKACQPKYPGTADWLLRQNDYYVELLKDLNNAKYQTMLYELQCLIVDQKNKRKIAELRARACEATLEEVSE